MVTCGNCKHWVNEFEGKLPDRDDDLGLCSALDPSTIPWSWRWCPRERTGVCRNEESDCPCYEEKTA